MKKILFAFVSVFLIFSCAKEKLKPLKIMTSGGEISYQVEVADTDYKRTKGLMKRTKLAQNSGMIFLFNASHPQPIAMWMKNTFIPLDMLFLSENFEIIAIVENTTPMSLKFIQPTKKYVAAVVELNAGDVKKHGIKTGDKIIFKHQINH